MFIHYNLYDKTLKIVMHMKKKSKYIMKKKMCSKKNRKKEMEIFTVFDLSQKIVEMGNACYLRKLE